MSRRFDIDLDEAYEQLLESLPVALRFERRQRLDALRELVEVDESLEAIAATGSRAPGILALTSKRLVAVPQRTILQRTLKPVVLLRRDLRGCRENADGSLSILRYEADPVSFGYVLPVEAKAALVRAVGPPPLEACRNTFVEATSQDLRDAISENTPSGDKVLVAVAAEDASGIVAITDAAVVWARDRPERDDIEVAEWPRGRLTPDALATLPIVLADPLCEACERLAAWDAVLQITSAKPFIRDLPSRKAHALIAKGLTDAALVVYDDAIREEKGSLMEGTLRYQKAALLVKIGELPRARRELARLYADEPTFDDDQALLERLKLPAASPQRAPIPEEVRHAV